MCINNGSPGVLCFEYCCQLVNCYSILPPKVCFCDKSQRRPSSLRLSSQASCNSFRTKSCSDCQSKAQKPRTHRADPYKQPIFCGYSVLLPLIFIIINNSLSVSALSLKPLIDLEAGVFSSTIWTLAM